MRELGPGSGQDVRWNGLKGRYKHSACILEALASPSFLEHSLSNSLANERMVLLTPSADSRSFTNPSIRRFRSSPKLSRKSVG